MTTYKRYRFPPGIISYGNGKQYYLWRAVDQDGEVVDVYPQAKRPNDDQ